jgi:hypothetical protein
MNKFIDLIIESNRLPLPERRQYVKSRVAELLSKNALNKWGLGDSVADASVRILIVIAAWSNYDLRLLDALSETPARRTKLDERIDIADIDEIIGPTENCELIMDKIIPEIGTIFHTPIVGIWENGMLVQKGSGAAGRDLIINRYGLNREAIIKVPFIPLVKR